MNDNSERYDRQIRLWGQHGQRKCYDSKVCLINATGLGSEILKGLCLAGIGLFTILDSNKLSADDIESIFISPTQIGKNRGEAVKSMLIDINEDVKGQVFPLETYLPLNHNSSTNDLNLSNENLIDDLFKEDTSNDEVNFWKQFNCVITASFLHIEQINRLSKICWALNIPLVTCKSIGFYGSLRIQMKEHVVADSHPEFGNNPSTPEIISTIPIFEENNLNFFHQGEDLEEENFLTIGLSLKAMDIFFSTYGRLPGCQDDQVETDLSKLRSCFRQISPTKMSSLDQCLYELSRFGGAELHVTSAFLGACALNEVIKLITNQYTPINDTIVYDATTPDVIVKTFRYSDFKDQIGSKRAH